MPGSVLLAHNFLMDNGVHSNAFSAACEKRLEWAPFLFGKPDQATRGWRNTG